MSKFLPALAALLGVAFAFFGIEKFVLEDKIFTTIADRSGIAVFDPYFRYFTAVCELGLAALFFNPGTRRLAALGGLGLVGGAIGFHLSPWLGISVPGMGIMVFVMAVMLFVLCGLYLILSRAPRVGQS